MELLLDPNIWIAFAMLTALVRAMLGKELTLDDLVISSFVSCPYVVPACHPRRVRQRSIRRVTVFVLFICVYCYFCWLIYLFIVIFHLRS